MKNRLASVGVNVDHRSIALLSDTGLVRNLCGNLEHVGQECRIFGTDVVQRRDVLLRADQDVHRRLRMNVVKCVHSIVFVDGPGGQFMFRDLAE